MGNTVNSLLLSELHFSVERVLLSSPIQTKSWMFRRAAELEMHFGLFWVRLVLPASMSKVRKAPVSLWLSFWVSAKRWRIFLLGSFTQLGQPAKCFLNSVSLMPLPSFLGLDVATRRKANLSVRGGWGAASQCNWQGMKPVREKESNAACFVLLTYFFFLIWPLPFSSGKPAHELWQWMQKQWAFAPFSDGPSAVLPWRLVSLPVQAREVRLQPEWGWFAKFQFDSEKNVYTTEIKLCVLKVALFGRRI